MKLGISTNGTTNGPFGSQNRTVSVTTGGILDLNSYNLGISTPGGSGTILNNAGGTTSTLTVGNNNPADYGSSILIADNNNVGTGKVAVEKVGTTQWQINNSNTYSGGTIVSGGKIRMQSSTSLGTGTITFNGGYVWRTGAGQTVSNAMWVNNVAGNTFRFDDNGGGTLSGSISGPGQLDLSNYRTGTNRLSGDLTGFTGTFLLGTSAGNNSYNLQRPGVAVQGSETANWNFTATTNTSRLQYAGTGDATIKLGGLSSASANASLRNTISGTTATFEIGAEQRQRYIRGHYHR